MKMDSDFASGDNDTLLTEASESVFSLSGSIVGAGSW